MMNDDELYFQNLRSRESLAILNFFHFAFFLHKHRPDRVRDYCDQNHERIPHNRTSRSTTDGDAGALARVILGSIFEGFSTNRVAVRNAQNVCIDAERLTPVHKLIFRPSDRRHVTTAALVATAGGGIVRAANASLYAIDASR
jgi:hypothetical protein